MYNIIIIPCKYYIYCTVCKIDLTYNQCILYYKKCPFCCRISKNINEKYIIYN